MRSFLAPLMLLCLLAGTAPADAGNVLLPSANGPQPNLGLAPAPQPIAPVAPSTQDQQANPPAPAQKPDATAIQVPQTKPAPAVSAAIMSPPAFLPFTPIPPVASKTRKGFSLPTKVINSPDMSILQNTSNMGLPKSVALDLDPKSSWGQSDITAVSEKFGISPARVTSVCSLSLGGLMNTDKGMRGFSSGGTPAHSDIGYDGTIKTLNIRVTALCPAGQLPPDSGFVTQIGNQYSIPIGSVSCQPPAASMRQIVVSYSDGKGQCAYR